MGSFGRGTKFSNMLDVLKGLCKLQTQIQGRKNDLLACLHQNKKISKEGKQWLYQDTNLVDEEALINVHKKASDYKCKLASFNEQKQSLIQKLMAAGTKKRGITIPEKKRAHM